MRQAPPVTALLCLAVMTVGGKAAANPVDVPASAQAAPATREQVEQRELANLRQVNTYLLQAVAKFRRNEEDLQSKITLLTETNLRLTAMVKEVDALRQQAAGAERDRRAALDQLNQERRAGKAQRDHAAALAKTNDRLSAAVDQAQRKTQQAEAALQRVSSAQLTTAEEAKNFKRQLQRSLQLEQENAELRQGLLATQEDLERLRRAHTQLTQGELKTLQDDNLALQAKLLTLSEENRRREQAVDQMRTMEREHQVWLQERVQLKLEADTLRQMLNRERAELYRELGAAYTKLQVFDKAIASYERALEAEPNHAQTHYYLGLLYEHAENNDERAVAHLQRYLALSPKLPSKTRKEIDYVINMLQTKGPDAAAHDDGKSP